MSEVIDFKEYKEKGILPPKLTKTYGLVVTEGNKKSYLLIVTPDGKPQLSELVSSPADFINGFIEMSEGDDPLVLFLEDLPHVDAHEEEES